MRELAVYIGLFILGNYLDYFTTYLGMKGLSPEEMKKRELNVLLHSQMHRKKLIVTIKFLVVGALVGLSIYHFIDTGEVYLALKMITIFMFLVVANNIHSHWAGKRGKLSFGRFLMTKIKLPKALTFIVVVATFWLITFILTGIFLI